MEQAILSRFRTQTACSMMDMETIRYQRPWLVHTYILQMDKIMKSSEGGKLNASR